MMKQTAGHDFFFGGIQRWLDATLKVCLQVAQRMNRNSFGTFSNMLEKLAIEKILSDTPGSLTV